MANQKISDLTEQTDLSLIDGLAGYQGTSNVRISGQNIIDTIPALYTSDGTITSPTHRKITLAGTSAQPNKASLEVSGASRQGDFKVGNGYVNNKWAWSWSMPANGVVAVRHFYQANFYAGSNHPTGSTTVAGTNYLSISAQGLEYHKKSIGIGINGTVNDRLVVKGLGVTSAKHSVRVLDNNDASMFSIRDDGAITIGKTGSRISLTGQASVDVGSGSDATINFDTGNMQEITIPSGATNFTPSNAVAGSTYMIKITQAGTSGTINWESSATVNWPGGTPPTLTTTNGGVDIITLICTVGGATGGTFYGTSALNFS